MGTTSLRVVEPDVSVLEVEAEEAVIQADEAQVLIKALGKVFRARCGGRGAGDNLDAARFTFSFLFQLSKGFKRQGLMQLKMTLHQVTTIQSHVDLIEVDRHLI